MAKQTVIVSLLADTKPFTQQFQSLGSRIGKFALGAVAAIGAIGATITTLAVKGGISRALNIEDAQAKLRGLGYDTDQVAAVMDSALGAVRGTAYGLDTAVTAAANAMAAGVQEGDQLERYLRAVADAATIAGTGMDEMGDIFGKITARGRLTTQEMNQLSQRGIPILQWLADEYGVTAEAMQDMVSSGRVSAEEFQNVVETNIGGAALESGKTTRGAFANMNAAMARWGEALAGGVLPIAREFFGAVNAGFDALTEVTKPIADEFWEFAQARMIPALEALRDGFGELVGDGFDLSGLTGIVSAFSPVLAIVQELAPHAQKLGEAVMQVGSAFGGALMDALPTVQALMSQFGEAVAGLVVELLPILADVLTTVAEAVGQLLPELVELGATVLGAVMPVISSLLPVIAELAGVFSDVLAAVLPTVVELLGLFAGLVEQLLPALMPLVPVILDIVTALAPLIEVFAELLGVILPPIVDLLTMMLVPILALVAQHFENLVPGLEMTAAGIAILADWIAQAVAWFTDFAAGQADTAAGLVAAWEAVSEWFGDLWANITSAFDTAWAIITDIVGTAWEVVSTLFGTAIETIKTLVAGGILIITQLFSGDFSGIQDTVRRVWDRIRNLFSGAISTVQNLVSGLVSRITGFFRSMMDGARNSVSNGLANVRQFFQNLPGQIMSFLSSLPQRLAQMGRDMIQGLINGIGGAAQWLKNAISNAIGGMLNWAKNLLGISSPSKVFAEIGRFTIRGLENGLKGTNSLRQIMTGLTSDIERSFDPTLEMNTRAGRFGAGVGGREINITVNTGVGDPVEIGREVARVLNEYKRSGGMVPA